MNFPLSFTWSYDPFGVISKLRVEQKATPYVHTQRPEIEKYMKQHTWVENTLQEIEEQILSKIALETPIPKEKTDKRPRHDDSPSVTEVSAKEFKIYTKKIKTGSKIEFPPPEDTTGSIVFSGFQTFKLDSGTTESPSSSSTKEILVTIPQTPKSSIEQRRLDIFQRYKDIK